MQKHHKQGNNAVKTALVGITDLGPLKVHCTRPDEPVARLGLELELAKTAEKIISFHP
jgi:hypothetical protein